MKSALTLALLMTLTTALLSAGVVSTNGRLRTDANRIVGDHGNPVAVSGVSHFWSQWEGEFYSRETIDWLVSDWQVTLTRAALGVQSGKLGYQQQPAREIAKIKAVVDAAIANDIYVLIDWHDHRAQEHTADAVAFFGEMARTYGHHPHVIYEIYNEPLKVSWSNTIKPYAERVIAAIRAHDPDNLIIVGTPAWSQRVDHAAADPIDDPNVAYTLHFYAATHKADLRAIGQQALDAGLPLMITEWGTVEANGDGAIDPESIADWMTWIKANHLSHAAWSVSNKNEGAAIVKPHVTKLSGWTVDELTANGRFLRNLLRGD
jgi:endoglucanase